MIFKTNKHSNQLYNILLKLSRNKFFYNDIQLPDIFETRIYLMFIHFALVLKIFKKKKVKFDQNEYDNLFHSIENNLRELGFGDVSVNEKMKNLNKILYDILVKIEKKNNPTTYIELNKDILTKYFNTLAKKPDNLKLLLDYFVNYYNYCFEIPLKNMLNNISKFN